MAIPLAVICMRAQAGCPRTPESIAGLRVGALLGVVGAAYGCFGAMLSRRRDGCRSVLGLETGWLALQLAGSWWLVHAGRVGQVGGRSAGGWPGGSGTVVALMTLATCVQLAQIATALVLWRTVFGGRRRT